MEKDRGTLIEIVESEDSRKTVRERLPWFGLVLMTLVSAFLLIYEAFLPWSYYVILIIVCFSGIAGSILQFLVLRHVFFRTTRPIKIYSNGVEPFPSPFYRLKGLSGFISKDRMDRIEVKVFLAYPTQESQRRPGGSDRIKSDLMIVLHTRDGKYRILGARSRTTAERVARAMQRAWNIPVVGIGEVDAVGQ